MDRKARIYGTSIYLKAPQRRDYAAWSALREASREHLLPWEPKWPSHANSRSDWRVRLRAWRDSWFDDRGYGFLIFNTETNRLLGGISLTNVRRGSAQSADLGYWLGQDALGQGHMLDAVQTLCGWATDELGLARIEASTLEANTKSQRVLERAGFQREGIARSYLEIAGRRRDHVLYGYVAPGRETSDN